jgi:polygalacturonase
MSLQQTLSDNPHPTGIATALQSAIDRLAESGGGTLTLPVGTWTTTTLRLRSGITLHLPFGCTLRAHERTEDYPLGTVFEGNKDRQPYHLITAHECENIAITGDGTIDGQGPAFWNPPMRELAAAGVDVDAYCDEHGLPPVYRNPTHPWFREKKTRVSPLLDFVNCRRLTLRDFTIKDSPGWTVHLHDCDDVRIQSLTIRNNLFGPNTDGLDINGCRDVRISDCDLTCGDDAIILKSMTDARTCERIAITNCILSSNCAAIGLGAETFHGIRDVTVTGCVIRQALRAVQIEMWDPGIIENVVVTGLTGTSVSDVPLQRAIYVDIQHHGRTDGALGVCRNLIFSNIALTTRGRNLLTAADGSTIEDVTLRDVSLVYPTIEDPQKAVAFQRSSQMSNDSPHTRDKPAVLVCDNVDRLTVDNLRATWPGEGRRHNLDTSANTPLNPFHGPVPMHGLWLRRVRGANIHAPFLRPHDPEKSGLPLIVQNECADVRLRD